MPGNLKSTTQLMRHYMAAVFLGIKECKKSELQKAMFLDMTFQLAEIRRAHNDNTSGLDNPSCYPGTITRLKVMLEKHPELRPKHCREQLIGEIATAVVYRSFVKLLKSKQMTKEKAMGYLSALTEISSMVSLREGLRKYGDNAKDITMKQEGEQWLKMRALFVKENLHGEAGFIKAVNNQLGEIKLDYLSSEEKVYLKMLLADVGCMALAKSDIASKLSNAYASQFPVIVQASKEKKLSEDEKKYNQLSLLLKFNKNREGMDKKCQELQKQLDVLEKKIEQSKDSGPEKKVPPSQSKTKNIGSFFRKSTNPLSGLTVKPSLKDGSCFYHSVLTAGNLKDKTVGDLRKKVSGELENHKADYEEAIKTELKERGDNRTVEQYLNCVRTKNEWATEVEIVLLMNILNRPIFVIDKDNQKILNRVNCEKYKDQEDKVIFVCYKNKHYDALLMNPGVSAKKVLKKLRNLPVNRIIINDKQGIVDFCNERPGRNVEALLQEVFDRLSDSYKGDLCIGRIKKTPISPDNQNKISSFLKKEPVEQLEEIKDAVLGIINPTLLESHEENTGGDTQANQLS